MGVKHGRAEAHLFIAGTPLASLPPWTSPNLPKSRPSSSSMTWRSNSSSPKRCLPAFRNTVFVIRDVRPVSVNEWQISTQVIAEGPWGDGQPFWETLEKYHQLDTLGGGGRSGCRIGWKIWFPTK